LSARSIETIFTAWLFRGHGEMFTIRWRAIMVALLLACLCLTLPPAFAGDTPAARKDLRRMGMTSTGKPVAKVVRSSGHAGTGKNLTKSVAIVTATVQNCIQTDDLLRRTCARIGHNLSEKNRAYCAVPADPFERRTQEPYRRFRESHREIFMANPTEIDKVVEAAQRAFERQFAEVIAGRVSMFDLESLHRQTTGPCVAMERSLNQPGGQR
jgi:hypothetical protein